MQGWSRWCPPVPTQRGRLHGLGGRGRPASARVASAPLGILLVHRGSGAQCRSRPGSVGRVAAAGLRPAAQPLAGLVGSRSRRGSQLSRVAQRGIRHLPACRRGPAACARVEATCIALGGSRRSRSIDGLENRNLVARPPAWQQLGPGLGPTPSGPKTYNLRNRRDPDCAAPPPAARPREHASHIGARHGHLRRRERDRDRPRPATQVSSSAMVVTVVD